MSTLIIRGEDGGERKVEVSGELSVGRDPANDLVLSDTGVSRRHCRFYLDEEGELCVEDLGSANGVLVDGLRIEGPTRVPSEVEILVGTASVRLEERPASPRAPQGAQLPARRSTALAKRPGPGPAQPNALQRRGVKSTRMMTATEAPARGQKARASQSSAEGAPRLKGQGRLTGVVFDLVSPKMTVGRVPPAEIVIDDDSVSRKHAEIIREGTGARLKDLASANGTFVNGERIAEAPLSPGDVIRFGVAEVLYSGPAAPKGSKINRKRLLAIAGGVAAVLLLAAVLSLSQRGGEARSDLAPTSIGERSERGAQASPSKDPLRELSRCKGFSDPDNEELNWKKAIEVCGQVLKLDSTLTEARDLERRAKHEVEFEDLLKEAQTKLSTSQEETALGMLVRIPIGSTSFNQARIAFKEATERLFKRSRSACKTDIAAGSYRAAVDQCRKAMEVTCNRTEGVDPEAKRLYEQAARLAGERSAFSCPPEYKPFEPDTKPPSEDAGEQQLRLKYPDKAIGDLMIQFYEFGRPKQVVDAFKRLRAKTGRLHPQIDDYIVLLELIDGRYASGLDGLRRGQPNLAWEYWKDAFNADARLMPKGVRSFTIREMSAQLAALDSKLGAEQYRMGRYAEAAKFIFDGRKFDTSNTDISRMMATWEALAKRMLDAEPTCESAQIAIDVTVPESQVHQRAEQLQTDRRCK